jgi:DNA invertase Pin-like site-specific DNA recombinase
VIEVKDVGSGATTRQKREKLIESARRREIDLVLSTSDRPHRSSRQTWFPILSRLIDSFTRSREVGFVSLSEALDLTTPSGRALAGMLAVFADNAERAIMRSHRTGTAVVAGSSMMWNSA